MQPHRRLTILRRRSLYDSRVLAVQDQLGSPVVGATVLFVPDVCHDMYWGLRLRGLPLPSQSCEVFKCVAWTSDEGLAYSLAPAGGSLRGHVFPPKGREDLLAAWSGALTTEGVATVRLPGRRSITGRLYGAEVGGATVTAVFGGGIAYGFTKSRADSYGRFELGGLPPGPAFVRALSPPLAAESSQSDWSFPREEGLLPFETNLGSRGAAGWTRVDVPSECLELATTGSESSLRVEVAEPQRWMDRIDVTVGSERCRAVVARIQLPWYHGYGSGSLEGFSPAALQETVVGLDPDDQYWVWAEDQAGNSAFLRGVRPTDSRGSVAPIQWGARLVRVKFPKEFKGVVFSVTIRCSLGFELLSGRCSPELGVWGETEDGANLRELTVPLLPDCVLDCVVAGRQANGAVAVGHVRLGSQGDAEILCGE
jgi:hypothetical protein